MAAEIGWAGLGIIPTFEKFGTELDRGTSKAMATAGKSGGEEFGDAAAKSGGDGFSSKIGPIVKKGALAAGGIAGIALGVGLAGALDNSALSDKLAAQLGVGAKKSAEYGKIAGELYSGAYGDSMESVNGAIRSVVSNLDGFRNASKSKISDITATVLDLNAAFDEEPEAITRAASQMVRTGLAKSSKQALDIITKGFQSGANKSEDLLDTFNEYGTQFRKLGLSGKAATGLLSQGLKGGARDADLVADAIKEFSIRSVESLETTNAQGQVNMTALGAAFTNVLPKTVDMYEAQQDLAKGGRPAREAFDLMVDGLRNIKDPVDRSKTAVALFGTQAEDLGDALYSLDPSKAVDSLGKVGGAAKRMGNTLNDNASAKIESFKRTMQTKLVNFVGTEVVPVLEDKVIPAIEDFSDWFTDKGIPAVKNFHDEAKPVIGVLRNIVRWTDKLPTEAKVAGLAAIVGGIGVAKIRGGGGGALGNAGKVLGITKPVKVYVVNQTGGGSGGGSPIKDKVPPVVATPGLIGKVGRFLGRAATVLPAAGAYGNDTIRTPKLSVEEARNMGLLYDKSLGIVNDAFLKVRDSTEKARTSVRLYDAAIDGLPSDDSILFNTPGLGAAISNTQKYGKYLSDIPPTVRTDFITNRINKNEGQIERFGGHLASGGNTRAGYRYRVGEHGPEDFVAPANGRVVSNQDLKGGRGGDTYNVTVMADDPWKWKRDMEHMQLSAAVGGADFRG